MKIYGEGLADLSFVDLPGVIAQSEQGDHVFELVKQLAQKYIREPNTLVLLACSMETDIMTSQASRLVTLENANHRCMGVLTKPDRLQLDSSTQWRDTLSGLAFKRGLGYFVTKQPAQSDLRKGVNHHHARKEERRFFKSSEWLDKILGFRDQLGTKKLAKALYGNLVKLIHNQLPIIQEVVFQKLEDFRNELDLLPPPPPNPFAEVRGIVEGYGKIIELLVAEDKPNDNVLRANCMTYLKSLKRALCVSLAPTLMPDPEHSLEIISAPQVELPNRSSPGPRRNQAPTTPNKRRQIEDSDDCRIIKTPQKRLKASTPSTTRSQPSVSEQRKNHSSKSYYLYP